MLRLLLAAALLAVSACHQTSSSPDAPLGADVVLRAGTSFGHCLGYCATELRVGPREAVLTRTSRDSLRNPPLTERLPLSAEEYEALVGRVDAAAVSALPEVIGCPDCADGGAEWIEVERAGGGRKRVTFEYGATVEPIAPLVARVRALRERFGDGPRGS